MDSRVPWSILIIIGILLYLYTTKSFHTFMEIISIPIALIVGIAGLIGVMYLVVMVLAFFDKDDKK